MKNLKYLFLVVITGLIVPSCVEDTAPEDAYGSGRNLVSFTNASQNISGIADGTEYEFFIPMEVKGPSMHTVNSATATVSVDESSTAVEGVHFRIDDPTVEFSSENDLLSNLKITLLSEGIEAPLDEDPVVVLNVETASGDNVIANGKSIAINLLYLCPSYLEGTYNVTVEYYRFGAKVGSDITYTELITRTDEGQYRTTRVGHWAAADLGGNPGFTFLDVCDVITIPEQNLVDLYSNLVEGKAGKSSHDPETGTIKMEYTICATDCREYISTYVRQ